MSYLFIVLFGFVSFAIPEQGFADHLYNYDVNKNLGVYLVVDQGKAGVSITSEGESDWTVKETNDGDFTIWNSATDSYLGYTDGLEIVLLKDVISDYSRWDVYDDGDYTYFRPTNLDDVFLGVDDGSLRLASEDEITTSWLIFF